MRGEYKINVNKIMMIVMIVFWYYALCVYRCRVIAHNGDGGGDDGDGSACDDDDATAIRRQ